MSANSKLLGQNTDNGCSPGALSNHLDRCEKVRDLTCVAAGLQGRNLVSPKKREPRPSHVVATVHVEELVSLVRQCLHAVGIEQRPIDLKVTLIGQLN